MGSNQSALNHDRRPHLHLPRLFALGSFLKGWQSMSLPSDTQMRRRPRENRFHQLLGMPPHPSISPSTPFSPLQPCHLASLLFLKYTHTCPPFVFARLASSIRNALPASSPAVSLPPRIYSKATFKRGPLGHPIRKDTPSPTLPVFYPRRGWKADGTPRCPHPHP